jgi:hypothetical protein
MEQINIFLLRLHQYRKSSTQLAKITQFVIRLRCWNSSFLLQVLFIRIFFDIQTFFLALTKTDADFIFHEIK